MAGSRSLRDRVAGQAAMSEVVSEQASAPPRGRIARLFGASPLTNDARASYRGALGELIVGDLLENLGSRWDVLHDLPLGDSLLDHLVIGPPGVFTVRAVNCSGEDVTVDGHSLTVGGADRGEFAVAIAEARGAAELLSIACGAAVHTTPLVVVVEPRRLVVRSPAVGVWVVASRDLHRMLTRRDATLDGDQVARISDGADLESTWSPHQATHLDTQRLHREFTAIRWQVNRARIRRVVWGAIAVTVVYVFIWAVVARVVGAVLHN